MSSTKCPVCGCDAFYCKNPEDDFETTGFSIRDGAPVPDDPEAAVLTPETEAYCDRCSWHAPLSDVLKR